MTGDVNWALATAGSASTFLQSGNIMPLAIAQKKRSPLFPNIPTVEEAGGPAGYEVLTWLAILAPRGTPPATIKRINGGLADVLSDSKIQEHLRQFGFVPEQTTAEQLAGIIDEAIKTNAALVKLIGASASQ